MIAWLLVAAGLPTDALEPPPGGRAPGWSEGLAAAQTSAADGSSAHSRANATTAPQSVNS